MKRIISLATALLLVAGQNIACCTYAEESSVISAVSTETVSISLTEETPVANGMITVKNDAEKLKLENAKAGASLKSGMNAVRTEECKVVLGFAFSKVITVEGTLLELEFTRISGDEDISELCSFTVDELVSVDNEGKEYNVDTKLVKFSENAPVVSVTDKVSEETSTPQVMLNISGNTSVTNGVFTVRYDADIVKYEKGTVCEAFEGAMAEVNEVQPGKIMIAFIKSDGVSLGGKAVKLSFTGLSEGQAKTELSVTEFTKIPVSGDVVSIPVQVVNSNISVFAPEETENDVDGNGVVNALDLMYIKKAIIDSANVSEDVLKRADINKNGELNVLDLIRLKQILLEQG